MENFDVIEEMLVDIGSSRDELDKLGIRTSILKEEPIIYLHRTVDNTHQLKEMKLDQCCTISISFETEFIDLRDPKSTNKFKAFIEKARDPKHQKNTIAIDVEKCVQTEITNLVEHNNQWSITKSEYKLPDD